MTAKRKPQKSIEARHNPTRIDDELAAAVAKRSGLSLAVSKAVVEMVLSAVQADLATGVDRLMDASHDLGMAARVLIARIDEAKKRLYSRR